jgi:hypothetical protein
MHNHDVRMISKLAAIGYSSNKSKAAPRDFLNLSVSNMTNGIRGLRRLGKAAAREMVYSIAIFSTPSYGHCHGTSSTRIAWSTA